MKKINIPFILIIIFSILLSGCTSSSMVAGSWPGLATDRDAAYVANGTTVMAVSISDGAVIWQFPAEPSNKQTFYANPAVSDTRIVIGDYINNLYSLDRETGNQQWVFTASKGRYIGGALIDKDMIYAPSADFSLYALNLQGNLEWKFETGQALWAQPVSDASNLYLVSMDHHLYALDKENGNLLWKVDLGGAIVSSPLLSENGVLYIGTLAEEVAAVDAGSGEVLWRYSTGNTVWSTPILREEDLYFGDSGGMIYSINTVDGKPRWQLETGSAITASGVQHADGLYFTTQSGELLSISFDGKKIWSHTVGGRLNTSPLLSGENVILAVMSGDNLLVCFDLNGNQRWTFQLEK